MCKHNSRLNRGLYSSIQLFYILQLHRTSLSIYCILLIRLSLYIVNRSPRNFTEKRIQYITFIQLHILYSPTLSFLFQHEIAVMLVFLSETA